MTRIFLIRHASPDWSRVDLNYYVPPGPPLSEAGLSEAHVLGRFLQQAQTARLLCSPLERCHHTAQIAGRLAGLTPEVSACLTEWQPGESHETVYARIWPCFEAAAHEAREGLPVGLVTHGGPISVLLSALGMDWRTLEKQRVYDNRNPLPPAGVWQVTQPGPGQPWLLDLVFKPDPHNRI